MGHKASNCPTFPADDFTKNEKRPLESVTCYKCGQMGHYANKVDISFIAKHNSRNSTWKIGYITQFNVKSKL
jgi:hypothetical protein